MNETLAEILQQFDYIEKKHFNRFDVFSVIGTLPEEVRSSEKAKHELLAFGFEEATGMEHWGTYYGLFSTWTRNDNGEEVLMPDKSMVTADNIAYWEQRAEDVKNPLLKMRYTGLVLYFKEMVTGVRPDFRKIRRAHIVALLDVAEGEYASYEYLNFKMARHGFDLAVGIKDKDLIERAVGNLISLDKKYSTDDKPGLSCQLIETLTDFRDYFSVYEDEILSAHVQRFDRLETNALNEGYKTDNFAHLLHDETKMLAVFYKKVKQEEKIKPLIDRLVTALRCSFDLRGGMWAQGMIQQMQALYRKYHLYEDANKLYVDIRELGAKSMAEMQNHLIEVSIEKDRIYEYWRRMLEGTDEDRWYRFLFEYLPRVEREKKYQEYEEKSSPLFCLIHTYTMDKDGVPINSIGGGDRGEEQRLMQGILKRLQISNIMLHEYIMKLRESGQLNADWIMNTAFKNSKIINDNQLGILKRAFDAYFADDYLVTCHLLIPQFESAIRNICTINGGEILRTQSKAEDGNEYKSLEGLLSQECVKKAIGEDFVTYYRTLFTDSNGSNWRNLVSHGLLTESAFNSDMADRIVHAFLLLSLVKPMGKD